MMTIKKLTATFILPGLLAGLASCAQKESYSSLEPTKSTSDADSGPKVVDATPRVTRIDNSGDSTDLRADNALLETRLVFFEFDKYDVSSSYLSILNAHASFLIENRHLSVVLQGHADERGSTEYNLALGQRRSDAVGESLVAQGVFPDQIETISYGEERPRELGSNEAAWAANRRVEIVYSDE